MTIGTCQYYLLLVLIYASFSPYQLDPLLCILVAPRFEMIVSTRREQAEDVFGSSFGIPLPCDRSEVGKGDLVTKLCFSRIAIDRKKIWSQDDIDWLP